MKKILGGYLTPIGKYLVHFRTKTKIMINSLWRLSKIGLSWKAGWNVDCHATQLWYIWKGHIFVRAIYGPSVSFIDFKHGMSAVYFQHETFQMFNIEITIDCVFVHSALPNVHQRQRGFTDGSMYVLKMYIVKYFFYVFIWLCH